MQPGWASSSGPSDKGPSPGGAESVLHGKEPQPHKAASPHPDLGPLEVDLPSLGSPGDGNSGLGGKEGQLREAVAARSSGT